MAVSPARNAARFSTNPGLHTRRHTFVFLAHASECIDADIAVDRRLHRVGIEEPAALDAKALLEHELCIGRITEEGSTIGLAAGPFGDETGNVVKRFPVARRHRHRVAELVLEGRLQLGIAQNIRAIIHDEDIAIVGKAVDGIPDLHLIVAIDRRDLVEFLAIAMSVDIVIERFEGVGAGEIRHP